MTVAFTSVYSSKPSDWTYLLAPGGTAPANQPWTGIYFASKQQKNLGQLSTISQIFSEFENKGFDTLAFLYFAAGAAPNPAQIGAALDAVNWRPVTPTGIVIWIADPTTINQTTIGAAPRLPLMPYPTGRAPVVPALNAPQQQPLLALTPGQAGTESLFVAGGGTVLIGADGTNDWLLLTCPQGLAVARGIAQADGSKTVATGMTTVRIPVGSAQNGCLVFDGALAGPISGIGLGFQFGVTVSGGTVPSGPLSYPLLDAPDGLAGWPASVVLSILAPLDTSQCYVALKPSGAIRSAFRTLLDRAVLLTPLADGSSRLVFNLAIGGTRYLVPSGAFVLSIDGGDEPNKYGLGNQLLCGLSGVEYIHFAQKDLLRFYPGRNAAVAAQIDPTLPKPANVSFAFGPPGLLTTAWAMVLPADAGNPDARQYYSEPDQGPFFTQSSSSSDARQLGYYGLTLSALPNDPGKPNDPYCFPFLPYASFVPQSAGLGADPVYVAAFEYQFINPTRKQLIEAMSSTARLLSHTAQEAKTFTAITPDGHAAGFADGNWQTLRIAQMSSTHADVAFSFAAADGATALPQPLQEAFLVNQQFLVITSDRNLGKFTWRATMDQWPFKVDLRKNTSVGDFRNVIVFKSANATVSQLARHPELWTRRKDFTDAVGDPDGRFLSNWLISYFEEAKQLYDDGKGVASLGAFCALIEDPEWNGFLALKVDIDTQALPAQVEALLSGIDTSLFVAHHIGNEINLVAPPDKPGQDYQLNSAMFGLVHYIDPALGPQVNNLPSYIANPQPYDFKVLTLEAIFENALLLNFSNKSLLTLNTLFGDAVQQRDPTGTAQGANTLVLIGSYNAKSDPAYTFSTAKGAVSDFYVASNALNRIEVTRTTMTVTEVSSTESNVTGERQCSKTTTVGPPPPGSKAYQAHFNLSGNFRMLADPAFDLMSYQSLGFENLGLDMYLVTGGGDRSFAFDSSGLRVALAQNVAVDPSAPADDGRSDAGSNLVRIGSLLAQFPLQLTGFICGCGGRKPDAMGFRTLETTKPDGVAPADLGSGDWYALSFGLNLGGQGALGQNGGLSAQMLLAWAPGGRQIKPCVLPVLKIAGPGGVSLSFDLEGVVKFGAADIVLNKMKSQDATPDQFVLMFESIAFSVLSFSFPPQGTTNIFLFGDATASSGDILKPTLGWFGGYVEKPAPVAKAGV